MSIHGLKGRKALVTGAARGLGAGIAEAFARAGAAVVIADVLESEGEATAAALRATDAKASFVKLDVTDEASWERAIARSISDLGGLDIVVNNAGIEISSLVIDIDPAGLRRMLEVNVVGVALGLKHAFRAMRPGGAAVGADARARVPAKQAPARRATGHGPAERSGHDPDQR